MEFETPRASFIDPLLAYTAMESDVFAAQFGTYVAQSIKQEEYPTPSAWSRHSTPSSSYSFDDSSTAADSADIPRSVSSSSLDEVKPEKKSKRANRYKDCSETALTRRREQNRANQRAYRKRKEQRIQELQEQLDEMSQKNQALACSCSLLSKECARLRSNQMASPAVWTPSQTGAQDPGIAALAAVYTKIEAALAPSGLGTPF